MKDIKTVAVIIFCFAMLTVSFVIMNIRDNRKDEARKVYITPSYSESTSSSTERSSASTEADDHISTIDINKAGKDDLIVLPGIGEVLADTIIRYRESNGNFRNIEEIMLVNGIGEGIFNNIKDYIFVTDPVYTSETQNESEIMTETETKDHKITTEAATKTTVIVTSATEEMVIETKYIPTLEDVAPIDLNTADADTLMLLPYVDETIADMIIELRNSINGFTNSYELLYVEGLSRKQVAEITEYVTVQPQVN